MVRLFSVFASACRGFYEDKCSLRASALTYYSLLSIVPVLAIAFGIAKGFGYDSVLEQNLHYLLKDHQAVADKIVEFVNSLLEQTKGNVVAGVGLVALLFTAGMLLSNIENALNLIWRAKGPRSFSRMFADYLAIIICCPLFFVLSSSIVFFALSELAKIINSVGLALYGYPVVYLLFYGSPLILSWLLFTFIYIFIPNTTVRFRYALLGGILAGTLYQIGLFGFLIFQYKLSNYGAIYGSFAALPLFLLWLQISWMILLLGAEFAYHASCGSVKNGNTQGIEATPSQVAIIVSFLCLKRAKEEAAPLSAADIARELGLGLVTVKELMGILVDSNLLTPMTLPGEREVRYRPTQKMENTKINTLPKLLSPLLSKNIYIKKTEEIERAIALCKFVD